MSNQATDFLMGGGVPSAKFPSVGDTVSGRIVRVGDPVQQRDYATGQPKFWDDGSPMMQLPVEVATDQRDPSVPDDDGTRCVWIKGQLRNAVRDAVRNAGANGLQVGGTLTVTYARDGQPSKKGFNAPKEYEARYTPPAAGGDFFGTNAPAPQPTQTTAPAPAPDANVDPTLLAAYMNLPAEQKDQLTRTQPALRAALGLPPVAA